MPRETKFACMESLVKSDPLTSILALQRQWDSETFFVKVLRHAWNNLPAKDEKLLFTALVWS